MRKILLVTAALAGFTALASQPAHAQPYGYGYRPYSVEYGEWRRHEEWERWRRHEAHRRWEREHYGYGYGYGRW